EIRARGTLVGDEHGAIGTHCQRLPQCVLRLRGPHRHEHDLARAPGVLQPEGFLDGVRVKRVERPLTRAIETLRVRVDPARALGDLLDADGDLHAGRTLLSRIPCYAPELRARTGAPPSYEPPPDDSPRGPLPRDR